MSETNTSVKVDFHFDVMCPWAYQTSLWMREVSERRDIEVNWRFLSLEEINLIKRERFGKNGLISSQFKILDLYQK